MLLRRALNVSRKSAKWIIIAMADLQPYINILETESCLSLPWPFTRGLRVSFDGEDRALGSRNRFE